jgi:hypothetical protein
MIHPLCKLTDLCLGGCYLETGSPFPLRTRIILSMQVMAHISAPRWFW